MKFLLTLVCFTFFAEGYSQYYFNDFLATQVSNDQYKLLRSNKIKKVTAVSYEPDNSIAEGFKVEQDISLDGKTIILNAITSGGKKESTTNRYELNRLKRTQSVSTGIDSRTEYTYNEKGLVQKILFTTTDTAYKSTTTEAHEWVYNETGQPISMLRVKNKKDTVQVAFVKDEQGMIAEEKWTSKGKPLETYYYYYDEKKQLTDIVRFNPRLRKFFPDYVYEYDALGRVSQLTQVSMSSASYIIWKYTYNEKGLKAEETGLDKEKKVVGKMVYSYE